MNKSTRKKIPPKIESDVMFFSDRKCCIDQKKGAHIHHIDGNSANNDLKNLALLCFECHDEASKTNSLSKGLSVQSIIKFRNHHYEVIKNKRNLEIVQITKKSTHPTYTDNINAAIQANVIVEIAKIKSEYLSSIKIDRNDILEKLFAFTDYNFPRVCVELFEFLNRVSYETRSGLPLEMINTVTSLVEGYFPPEDTKITKSQIERVGKLALQIAFGIIYDTSIYSHKLNIMKEGYDLLQFINGVSNNLKNDNLKKELQTTIDEIERTLNRPERNDLGLAKSMFNSYKKHLENNIRQQPDLSDELEQLIYKGK